MAETVKDAAITIGIAVDVFWRRYEGWIIVALGSVFLLVCAHIGSGRAR